MKLEAVFEPSGGYDCMTDAYNLVDETGKILALVDGRYFGQESCEAWGELMPQMSGLVEFATRLAACWNACEGLPTETLQGLGRVQAVQKVIAQRDELLAHVEYLAQFSVPEDFVEYEYSELAEMDDRTDVWIRRSKIRAARATLKKIKGATP